MKKDRGTLTIPSLWVALGMLGLLWGCQTEADGHDMEFVASSFDQLSEWREVTVLEELWKVGLKDGPEHQVLGRVGGATFVGAGLAVSDSHSNRIHWFDSSGTHQMSAGQKGGGPGEFVMIHSLGPLPDGTLAALDLGGGIELFDANGEPKEHLRFPGSSQEMCVADSTLVVLGTLGGSDRPLHLMDFDEGTWNSVGTAAVPEVNTPDQRILIDGSMEGRLGCISDRIIFARTIDGTVSALSEDGSLLWTTRIPFFVSRRYSMDPKRGLKLAPPDGANEYHGFLQVLGFGNTVAAQIGGRRIGGGSSFSTVFLDLNSGEILGADGSLPEITAADQDRIAVTREAPWPEIVVYSIAQQ